MLKKLDWDTEFFGVSCAKSLLESPLSAQEKENFLQEIREYDFVSAVNVDCDRQNALFLGDCTNGFLADVNVHFTKKTAKGVVPEGISVIEGMAYNEKLVKLSTFEHSKFCADRKLRVRGGDRVYEQWLTNAFEKEGKFFAVAEDDLGYCLFSFDEACVIELIRVDERARGQGIGKKLFAAVEKTACDRGFDTISVGTQLTNVSAMNFYTSCGARFERADAVYHLWNK